MQTKIRNVSTDTSWQTKATDRFVLKWIKCHLSARITPHLVHIGWLRPWMITVSSSSFGMAGGLLFALGIGWGAGLCAAIGQVLDGVDGQFARLTERANDRGAFLDSVLDRYADGAMLIGMIIYLSRISLFLSVWVIPVLGAFALLGSNGISYTSARAASLGMSAGNPTLASKGTRTTAMIISAFGTLLWKPMPFLALSYLAVHTNLEVLKRIIRTRATG
jgi:phosphatidylglycerophosphate synthase